MSILVLTSTRNRRGYLVIAVEMIWCRAYATHTASPFAVNRSLNPAAVYSAFDLIAESRCRNISTMDKRLLKSSMKMRLGIGDLSLGFIL